MKTSYEEQREAVKAEQSSMDYEEIKELLSKKSEHIVELDKLLPQEHHWINRGEVMSCEGAGHPNHRSFKFRGVQHG